MTAAVDAPWERLARESEASYVRFLIYRNLGPRRSINAAYAAYTGECAEGGKRRKAPGNWQSDAVAYGWVVRARAWDIAVLERAGRGASGRPPRPSVLAGERRKS